jgi:hypothetical protein
LVAGRAADTETRTSSNARAADTEITGWLPVVWEARWQPTSPVATSTRQQPARTNLPSLAGCTPSILYSTVTDVQVVGVVGQHAAARTRQPCRLG